MLLMRRAPIQLCQPGNVVIHIYPCLGTWAGHHRINMPPLLTTVSPVINWAPSPSTSQSTRAAISEGDAVGRAVSERKFSRVVRVLRASLRCRRGRAQRR